MAALHQHIRTDRDLLMIAGVDQCAIIANAPHPVTFQRLLYTHPGQREASQYIRGFRDPANDALVKDHGLTGLSMGMSGDYEAAIAQGSTILRVGASIFGGRRAI